MSGKAPKKGAALGPGGEFDLIRRMVASLPETAGDVTVGPGDDGAVVAGEWVLSTDVSVEDVHFRRRWISDREVGYRAAAAALSDLAAMAAEPVGVLVSLAYPVDGRVDPEAVNAGVQEAAGLAGAAVLGGDVSRSPGPLFVDVTVVGRTTTPVLRSGAVPGDEVWVTGALGGSAAAVRLWEAGAEPSEDLRRAYARPVPRVAEARSLAGAGLLRAMVDLSDGLAGDAGHLAAAGGVAIVLETHRVPVAAAVSDALDAEAALEAALFGGEDYELCFVAPAGAVEAWSGRDGLAVDLTRVGRVEPGGGVWLEDARGIRAQARRGGHDHLRQEVNR